jgi:hypothetical protein
LLPLGRQTWGSAGGEVCDSRSTDAGEYSFRERSTIH